MRKRKFRVNALTGDGLDELIAAVESEQKRLKDGVPELVRKAAERGKELAEANFATAEYDGATGEISVIAAPDGDSAAIVRASGEKAAFVEFGTGVKFPDNYPDPQGRGLRGKYGQGHGANPEGWHYKGEPGSHGKEETGGKWKGYIHTYGNPANAPVYESKKKLLDETQSLVDEVFNRD